MPDTPETVDPKEEKQSTGGFGKTIAINVISGLVVALLSWFASRMFYEPPIETVSIKPSGEVAEVNTFVSFAAETSVRHDRVKSVEWGIGGIPIKSSGIAQCSQLADFNISCQFLLPGTHSISAKVISKTGHSVFNHAPVTVEVKNGYVGFTLLKDDEAAAREFAYGIDWPRLQSTVRALIVIKDPETGQPIYAASLPKPNVSDDKLLSWKGAAEGYKVMVPILNPIAREAFAEEFNKIGVVSIRNAPSEIFTALVSGIAEGGFVPLSLPSELASFHLNTLSR